VPNGPNQPSEILEGKPDWKTKGNPERKIPAFGKKGKDEVKEDEFDQVPDELEDTGEVIGSTGH